MIFIELDFAVDKKLDIHYFETIIICKNMKFLYYNHSNQLMLEKIELNSLCTQLQTPFYIYSTNEIKRNCSEVISITNDYNFLACYALKANYNPHILKIISQMGFGADVVSAGELYFALKCGIPAKNIVFAGVGKTEQEIRTAILQGIHSLNVESEGELSLVAKIAKKLNANINLAFRLNPDIDPNTHPYISTGLHVNKFGIERTRVLNLYKKARKYSHIFPTGIHVHIGSQISKVEPYLQTANSIIDILNDLSKLDIDIKFIDLGGGIGINYHNQLDSKNMSRTYLVKILPAFLNPFKSLKLKIIMELGRSIVGTAGLLITKVLYIKETSLKKFIIVDAAMNNFIRPCLYQAYHQILPLTIRANKNEKVDVVGPVCETSDYFAKDRDLPILKVGDYLAITASGAYGQVLSSNYNLRPSIPEYIIHGDKITTIYGGESVESIAAKYSW